MQLVQAQLEKNLTARIVLISWRGTGNFRHLKTARLHSRILESCSQWINLVTNRYAAFFFGRWLPDVRSCVLLLTGITTFPMLREAPVGSFGDDPVAAITVYWVVG